MTLTSMSLQLEDADFHATRRRFKAAYAAFEERKLEEMADDKSLRRQQKIEAIRKEFEKSPVSCPSLQRVVLYFKSLLLIS